MFNPIKLLLVSAVCLSGLAAMAQTSPGTAPPEPRLSEMDSNGDGAVTIAEADQFLARGAGDEAPRQNMPAPAGRPAPSDGPPPAEKPSAARQPGHAAPGHPPGGAEMDSNGDGIIQETEFRAMMDALPEPPRRDG